MFGLSDNKKQIDYAATGPQVPYQPGPMPASGPAVGPTYTSAKTVNPTSHSAMPSAPSAPAPLPMPPYTNSSHNLAQPSQPVTQSNSNGGTMKDVNLDNAYIATDPAGTTPPASNDPPSAASLVDTKKEPEDLMQMKHQALQSLSPLINKLDQTPEEKFKTTMQMIQASDNPQLIKEAYEAANQISDEKIKAQALLDIVNEINYFTHQNSNPEPTAS